MATAYVIQVASIDEGDTVVVKQGERVNARKVVSVNPDRGTIFVDFGTMYDEAGKSQPVWELIYDHEIETVIKAR